MTELNNKIKILKDEIEKVFSDTKYPGAANMLHKNCCKNGDCKDDNDIAAFYGITDWRDVPNEVIEYENAALSFFSPEAYQFYLPRFMIYALENYDSEEIVVDNLIYSLCPKPIDYELSEEILKEINLTLEFSFPPKEYFEDKDVIRSTISKYSKLTNTQRAITIKFLEFIDMYLVDHFDEHALEGAIEFWRNDRT